MLRPEPDIRQGAEEVPGAGALRLLGTRQEEDRRGTAVPVRQDNQQAHQEDSRRPWAVLRDIPDRRPEADSQDVRQIPAEPGRRRLPAALPPADIRCRRRPAAARRAGRLRPVPEGPRHKAALRRGRRRTEAAPVGLPAAALPYRGRRDRRGAALAAAPGRRDTAPVRYYCRPGQQLLAGLPAAGGRRRRAATAHARWPPPADWRREWPRRDDRWAVRPLLRLV